MTEAAELVRGAMERQRAGQPGEARAGYRAALAVEPVQPDVWHVLALLAAEAGDLAEAVDGLRRALLFRPEDADLWSDLGGCLHQQGRASDAERALRAALIRRPEHGRALATLGLLLASQTGRGNEAEAMLRAALRQDPAAAATQTNLGNLLRDRGRVLEAEMHLRAALALRPGLPDAWHNLAMLLADTGRLAEAATFCEAGLAAAPGNDDLRFLLGITHLRAGRLLEGWDGFARRWHRRGQSAPRRFEQPEWDGADWTGALLLYAEEGLGDTIQMLRFVPALAARGRVVLEVPAALTRLAATLPGNFRLVAAGDPPAPFDRRCALMDLPRLLRIALDGIPAGVPYLAADPAADTVWRDRLAGLSGLRVGLVWAGNPFYPADARRSLPPGALAALAGLDGISWVSLQMPSAQAPLPLTDWTGEIGDLADTAALVAGLDLVIAVDTAVAHLAGALGIPVWLLNRADTCWRWMVGRSDSPWYPTMRIFRQPAPGNWDPVLAEVRAALVAFREEAGRPPRAHEGK